MTPPSHPKNSPPLWKRLPQWVNQLMIAVQGVRPQAAELTDPQHVHLFFPPDPAYLQTLWNGIPYLPDHPWMQGVQPVSPGTLDVASFVHALEQIPTAHSIEFSGWGDPLAHPDITTMIREAVSFNGMVTRLHTHGQTDWDVEAILNSSLDHLVVQLVAHRPSLYSAIVQTRQPLSLFTKRESQIRRLIQVRDEQQQHNNLVSVASNQKTRSTQSALFIEVTMVLDSFLLDHLPEMIEYGLSLGVDGIRFENYMDLTGDSPSLQTLSDQPQVLEQLNRHFEHYHHEIRLEFPPLLASDVEHLKYQCADPHTQVSLTPQLQVSPCSVHLALPAQDNTIWNQHFWHHPDFTALRQVHADFPHASRYHRAKGFISEVPLSCRICPKNSPYYSPLHHA